MNYKPILLYCSLIILNIVFVLASTLNWIDKWITLICIYALIQFNIIGIVTNLTSSYPVVFFDDSNYVPTIRQKVCKILYFCNFIVFLILFILFNYNYLISDNINLLHVTAGLILLSHLIATLSYYYYYGFTSYSGIAYFELLKNNNNTEYDECFLPISLSEQVYEIYAKDPLLSQPI